VKKPLEIKVSGGFNFSEILMNHKDVQVLFKK